MRAAIAVRRGFTLIELLVVVAIIALLIAILLPSLARAKQVSIRTQCGTNLSAIGRAMQAYNAEYSYVALSQRGWFNTSGWATNQLLHIRTDLSSRWSVPGFLAPYIGGPRSKLLVCPAVAPTLPVGAMRLSNGSAINWNESLQPVQAIPPSSSIWGYGTYLMFSGDRGNGVTVANPGGTNPRRNGVDYWEDAAMTIPLNVINVPYNLNTVEPGQVLAQDHLQRDIVSNKFTGNHTRNPGGNYLPDTATFTSRWNLNSGYYIGDTLSEFAGANVLLANYAVEWRAANDLRPVVGGGSAAPQ